MIRARQIWRSPSIYKHFRVCMAEQFTRKCAHETPCFVIQQRGSARGIDRDCILFPGRVCIRAMRARYLPAASAKKASTTYLFRLDESAPANSHANHFNITRAQPGSRPQAVPNPRNCVKGLWRYPCRLTRQGAYLQIRGDGYPILVTLSTEGSGLPFL